MPPPYQARRAQRALPSLTITLRTAGGGCTVTAPETSDFSPQGTSPVVAVAVTVQPIGAG